MAKAKLEVGSLDQIRSAQDVGQETVDVPEWGVAVTVRGLTRGEARLLGDDAAEAEVRALQLALVEPAVSEDEAREILASKGFAATERVLRRILDLSGLGESFRS